MENRKNDLPPAQFGLPYDCEPTLNDAQVFDFCRKGYLILEGVVDDDVNRRMMAFAAEHTDHQPLELLTEEWFVEGVFKNPQAAGAVRSLLGANFKLPQTLCNHRADGPLPPQDWHRDGGSIYNNRIDYLQVFYYPQDTPPEMGPTELIPGSHFMRSKANYMGHIRSVKPVKSTASPAGTVTITAYPIWHRRGRSVLPGVRHLFKYNYFRTAEPRRDWVIDPEHDFSWPDMSEVEPHFEQFRCGIAAAELFSWLCGEQFDYVGGTGWPCEAPVKPGLCDQEGLPAGLRRFAEAGIAELA